MTETYYVVEFRLAKQINDAANPKTAANKALRQWEEETGINLSAWFCRVFEYNSEKAGPVAEYFSNPAGTGEMIRIDKNHTPKIEGQNERERQ